MLNLDNPLFTTKDPQPGDIGWMHSSGTMGHLIRIGESISFKGGSEVNHEFYVDRVEDGKVYVIQAQMKGVTDTHTIDEMLVGGFYITMPPPKAVDRVKMREFMHEQVGIEYGIGTDIAIGIDMVTWDWVPAFRAVRKLSWICSAVVEEGQRAGGWFYPWKDIYNVNPAQSLEVHLRILQAEASAA